jgi:16S rRNA (cytosine967-C5)-methyltransferase
MWDVSPARRIAFEVLQRVEKGGFAPDLLLERSRALDNKDAGLAAEITLGVLRRQAQLDFLIQSLSGKAPARLDTDVKIALRMGIYQIRHLNRVPSYAAVDEAVRLTRRAGYRSAAGFVNAVLRKAHRDPVAWPDRATELSVPAWLWDRWKSHFGERAAGGIAKAFLAPPETYVRLWPEEQRLRAEAGGLRLESTGPAGCFRVLEGRLDAVRCMDIGSQTIPLLLDLAPGLDFLDVCAAPGNKTAQALESGVRAVACDSQWRRLVTMPPLGCPMVVADATLPLPFRKRFDRILVDAPCSGTGTIGRNPEIRWRLQPEDLLRFQERQARILGNALALLKPGGRIVYSTCSLEPEESERVVEQFGDSVEILETHWRIPGRDAGDGFYAAVLGLGVSPRNG